MARRKKGGMVALGGAFGKQDKRRKHGGLAGMAPGFGKRGRRGKKSLSDWVDLGDKVAGRKRRERRGSMARQTADSLRERLTPTERAQIRREVDEAIENDRMLSGAKADAKLTGNETFLSRMIRVARERFRKPVL